jgi:hypothetical protein
LDKAVHKDIVTGAKMVGAENVGGNTET